MELASIPSPRIYETARQLLVGGQRPRECFAHVSMQQAMEQVLAGFAADGKAPGDVSAGSEAALHGVADGHVFVLNFFADGDALPVMLRGGGADVREIVMVLE